MFVTKSLSKSELNETEILLHEVVIYATRGLNLCTMNVSLGIHLGNFWFYTSIPTTRIWPYIYSDYWLLSRIKNV